MALLLALMRPGVARAQEYRPPADITQVTVDQLSNGVRVTVKANGIIDLDTSPFWGAVYSRDKNGRWQVGPTRRVPFNLTNCRTKVGAFYNIGCYPVSHVELATDTNDPYGIGVRCAIVFYQPVTAMSFSFWGEQRSRIWVNGDPQDLRFDLSVSPDRTSIVLTVTSNLFPVMPYKRMQPDPNRPERLSVAAKDGLLSATAQYVPLRRLLDEVASSTGERILVEDGLERTVSLHLEDVPVRDFLDGVAATYGLTISRLDGEWMVGDGLVTAASNYLPSLTRRFPLKYLAPGDAVNLLPNFLLAYAHPDQDGNALVMSGPVPMLDKVAADLAKIDVPPALIKIEALVVESTRSGTMERFLDLHAASPHLDMASQSLFGDLSYQRVSGSAHDLGAAFTALEQRGLVKVRARPSMTVLSGRKASLFVGGQRYIQVSRRLRRSTRWDLRAIPVGVSLDVTPWTGGQEISLDIAPQVTTIDSLEPATHVPTLGVRRATATIRVRPKESVLISGVRMSQGEANARRVPILGDLPLVGSLFRSKGRSETATEIYMFVTAEAVTPAS